MAVDSISATGEPELTGDVTLSAGDGIVLTQAGQDIEVAVDVESPTNTVIGAVTATSRGTTVTGGAANTKGLYTQLSASTPAAAEGFTLVLARAVGDNYMLDVALGAAAAEVDILSNLTFEAGLEGGTFSVFIPLPIPAGSRVSVRTQNQAGAIDLDVTMILHSWTPYSLLGLTTATTYGATTASTTGVTLTYSGSPNTKNATWQQLSASTTGVTKLLLFMCGLRGSAVAADTSALIDIGVGAAASEVAIVENISTAIGSDTDLWFPQAFLLPVDIPAGSRLAARQQIASDQAISAMAIGFS